MEGANPGQDPLLTRAQDLRVPVQHPLAGLPPAPTAGLTHLIQWPGMAPFRPPIAFACTVLSGPAAVGIPGGSLKGWVGSKEEPRHWAETGSPLAGPH